MNNDEQEPITRLVQKLSDYSGLSVDVLNERLQERNLDPEATITLLEDQIFCYEADAVDFASEIQELQKPSVKQRHEKFVEYA